LAVTLTQKETGRQIVIRFRLLFDDGLFSLWISNSKKNLTYFIIMLKEPSLPWREIILLLIPGDYDTQE
jgi:hypothetical protein